MLFKFQNPFWTLLCIDLLLCQCAASKLSALQFQPSSRTELLTGFKKNASETSSPSSRHSSQFSSGSPAKPRIINGRNSMMTLQQGRGIVSTISEQASNIGKGILNFLRGSPSPIRRGPVSYPGPPVLRPFPGHLPHSASGPKPHLSLGPPGVPMSTNRIGPIFPPDSLQGGFLPSKNFVGTSLSSSGTGSVLINTSKVELPNPKAPCDFYTDSLCISSHPYPIESLRRISQIELPRLRHMIADVQDQNANVLVDGVSVQEEVLYTYEHYYGSEQNNTHSYKDYGSEGGFVCPSDIRYVQIKRAKSAKGKWKVIVNFDDFSQTLRLEKCLKLYSRCSYVFSYLNSECVQIYNYQRLVSWDQDIGFHVDIYKVPTACSCHLRSSSHLNSVTEVMPASSNNNQEMDVINTSTEQITERPPLFIKESQHSKHSQEFVPKHLPLVKPSLFQESSGAKDGQNFAASFTNDFVPSHQRQVPNFRLVTHNNRPADMRHQPLGNDHSEKNNQRMSNFLDNGGRHPLSPDNQFQGTRPFVNTNQHRGNKLLVGHKNSDVSRSTNRRINYSTNPISDFLHPWSGQ